MSAEPRPWTEDECRQKLLAYVWEMVEYWENETRRPDTHGKLTGLAFSLLVMLDGGSGLPGWTVAPSPHPDDEAFHKERGENWWPTGVDVAGSLHELFYPVGRQHGYEEGEP